MIKKTTFPCSCISEASNYRW